MRYLLILLLTSFIFAQSIPSAIPRDNKNTPASVLMYFDESDSTYHYLRIDSLNADIITELQTLNAKSFSTTAKQDSIEVTLNAMQVLLSSLDGKDFSTATNQSTIISSLTTIQGYIDQLEGYLDGVETSLIAIDANTDRNTTGGQGTQTVTTSAAALPSQASKVVWLENQNTSGNIYYGFSSGVTTSNGRLLSPMTAVKIETDNLSDIYVIASSSLTIRYSYQN